MDEPIIIPTDPFDAARLAAEAKALQVAGVTEWEFDFVPQAHVDELLLALYQAGVKINFVAGTDPGPLN